MRTPLSAGLTIALVFLPILASARTDINLPQKSPTLLRQEMEERQRQRCRACSVKPTRQEEAPKSYTNATYGFSLQVPEGWTMMEDHTAYQNALRVAVFMPGEGAVSRTTKAAMAVVVEQPAPSNLETYLVNAAWWLKESLPGFLPLQVEPVSIGGIKGYSLVLTGGTESNPTKAKQVFLIQNDTTYVISLWTTPKWYDALVPTFDAMVGSFVAK